jgi:hypothetical protein
MTGHPLWSRLPGRKNAQNTTVEKKHVLNFENPRERYGYYSRMEYMSIALSIVVYAAIITTIGGISRFHRGESTFAQRFWTMAWLAVGLSCVLLKLLADKLIHAIMSMSKRSESANLKLQDALFSVCYLFGGILLSVPAIGGLVFVGQMLKTYGICTELA